MEFLSAPDLSKEQEEILLRTVVEQFSCYLSLNSVEEWPEFFEDNFPSSGKCLNDILTKSETQNPDVLVMAKKVAVDIVNVICFKFGEHVQEYIEPFFESVWKLLPLLPSTREFNRIVQSVIEFVSSSLRERNLQKKISERMEDLFNHLILKHLSFTPEDLEEFDCNEEAFIKLDLEENDRETRRRACFNLIRQLTDIFPDNVGTIVNHYQSQFLDQYKKNPSEEWEQMVVVLNLIIASTVTRYTFQYGAVGMRLDQDTFSSYMSNLIIPELQDQKQGNAILKSQCLKFVLVYRNFIPRDWIMDMLKQLGFYLGNENYVVRVYAACCLERFMSMRSGEVKANNGGLTVEGIRNTRNPVVISKDMISEVLYDMLMALNTIIKESEGINQYSIIALNRLVLISEENFNQYAENYATAVADYV